LFLAVLAENAVDPLAQLERMEVPASVRGQVADMVAAYLRSCELERCLSAPDGGIAEVLADESELEALATTRRIPQTIGGYLIEGVLGSSRNAAVLRARQEFPIARTVALKLIFADAAQPAVAARVALERQILAELEHPGIARLYDFGVCPEGRPFLVMEFVRNGAIDAWCRETPLGPRALVREIFLPVCAAVRFAHARGVLHRDIKPANVLMQVMGEEVHPKLIDFGISEASSVVPGADRASAPLPRGLGTMRWLSPEALDPMGARLDVRSDVFGLGLLLFELLAGRSARDPAVLAGIDGLRGLVEDPVPRVRDVAAKVDEDVDSDLDAIVAKACALHPADRYGSVDAMIFDLEAWLDGEEVRARPRGIGERVLGALRNAWPFAMTAAVGAIVLLIAVNEATRNERERVAELRGAATIALKEAAALRNDASQTDALAARIGEALRATHALHLLRDGDREIVELRAAALEEAILPRLMRSDYRSPETLRLVEELVNLRARIHLEEQDALSQERYSVALAYQLDTVRGTAAYEPIERRQLELDEDLFTRFPESRLFADNLCWTYQRAHDAIWRRGERDRAMALLRRSGEIAEQMLQRHGRTPQALHTATASAWYEAMAAEVEGRTEDLFRATARARRHGTELLAESPRHRRGAVFLLRGGITEAEARLDLNDARGAIEVLQETRALAAPVIAYEAGSGFFGFPIAESWQVEARAWLALEDPDRAELAVREMDRERYREREPIQRAGVESAMGAAVDALRLRIQLARGESDQAEDRFRRLLAVAEEGTPEERAWLVEALAHHMLEHAALATDATFSRTALRRWFEMLRATAVPPFSGPADGRAPRTALAAIAGVLQGPDDVERMAAALRAQSDHNPSDVRLLRRLIVWSRSFAG
jgi:hypothetical protein